MTLRRAILFSFIGHLVLLGLLIASGWLNLGQEFSTSTMMLSRITMIGEYRQEGRDSVGPVTHPDITPSVNPQTEPLPEVVEPILEPVDQEPPAPPPPPPPPPEPEPESVVEVPPPPPPEPEPVVEVPVPPPPPPLPAREERVIDPDPDPEENRRLEELRRQQLERERARQDEERQRAIEEQRRLQQAELERLQRELQGQPPPEVAQVPPEAAGNVPGATGTSTAPRVAAVAGDVVVEGVPTVGNYGDFLVQAVSRRWHSDRRWQDSGLATRIALRVLPDGSFVNIMIVGSSGNPEYDAAALAAVQDYPRGPAFPEFLREPYLDFILRLTATGQ